MGVWYCTREDVMSALDFKETARNTRQVDRAIESASRMIEGMTHRRFYPETDTRFFDWPNDQSGRSWRLWLDQNELISVTKLTAGGVEIPAADFFLEPANDGPPYTHIEIDLDSSSVFSSGGTHQRAISVLGVFGYSAEFESAGTITDPVATTTATTINVSDSSLIGVGDLIKLGTEHMIVTGRSMLDTGQNIGANLDASNSAVTVPVTDGTAFHAGETLLIGSERMLIVDIAGNSLIVKRAWDGSVLAAHTSGADIYASRTLTVERGALGTTAATHLDNAAVSRHVVPGAVRALAVAESLVTILNETSGYARTVGAGESEREAAGRAVVQLRKQVMTLYGRMARTRAV